MDHQIDQFGLKNQGQKTRTQKEKITEFIENDWNYRNYQEFNECTDDIDEISGEESITEESTKKGKEKGSAHEICDWISRIGWWEMHVLNEIKHQIACICQICQILQNFNDCHNNQRKKFNPKRGFDWLVHAEQVWAFSFFVEKKQKMKKWTCRRTRFGRLPKTKAAADMPPCRALSAGLFLQLT